VTRRFGFHKWDPSAISTKGLTCCIYRSENLKADSCCKGYNSRGDKHELLISTFIMYEIETLGKVDDSHCIYFIYTINRSLYKNLSVSIQ